MTVTERWYDRNQQIILQTYEALWDPEDYVDSYQRMMEMAASRAPENIYIICDIHSPGPVQARIASKMLFVTKYFQPNVRFILLVGADAFTENLLNLLAPMMPQIRRRTRLVDTVAEAEWFIEVARRALGDYPPDEHLNGQVIPT